MPPAFSSWFEVKTSVVGIVVFETLQQRAGQIVLLQIAMRKPFESGFGSS
jgi:hypothetical protein